MSLFSRLAGIVGNFFQIGGPAGPGLNNSSGAIEARNAANNAYVVVRGADPVADNDLVTKRFLAAAMKPFVVTAQTIAPSALIANTGTEHYIVVTKAGTGAAAGYTLGTILWDDGQSTGNVSILGPTLGLEIVTTASFVGGDISLSANQNYMWNGSTWFNVSPSVAGATYAIDLPVLLATATSTTSIPANAVITRCELKVTTPYSGGTTVTIGRTGSLNLLQDTGDNFPTVANEYDAHQRTDWGASPLPLIATVAGSPAAGAAKVLVEYVLPLS